MMSSQKEIWKSIKGYEGLYEVSNLGRVKSLKRIIMRKNGIPQSVSEKTLKPGTEKFGYKSVVLCKDKKQKTFNIHNLVYSTFGKKKKGQSKLVIDHKDGNPANDNIRNLHLITQRLNISKGFKRKGKKLPAGVCYDKERGKYIVRIRIENSRKFLGRFDSISEAGLAYQNEVAKLEGN